MDTYHDSWVAHLSLHSSIETSESNEKVSKKSGISSLKFQLPDFCLPLVEHKQRGACHQLSLVYIQTIQVKVHFVRNVCLKTVTRASDDIITFVCS